MRSLSRSLARLHSGYTNGSILITIRVARYLDHTTTLSKGKSGLRCGSPTMLLPTLWRVVSVARTIYIENETIISIHIDDI